MTVLLGQPGQVGASGWGLSNPFAERSSNKGDWGCSDGHDAVFFVIGQVPIRPCSIGQGFQLA